MDGNNLTALPVTPTPPSFAAMLEEMQRAREAAHGGAIGNSPAPVAEAMAGAPASSAKAGISARELLEELRTGKLAAEQAFLERARQAMAMPGNFAVPTAVPAPMPTATPAATPAPAAAAAPVGMRAPQIETVASAMQQETAAATMAVPAVAPNAEKHLIVSLGEGRYAIPMEHILEIAELVQYTPVPNVPEWLAGIVNLRGDILSLVDLNALQGDVVEDIQRGSSLLVTQTRAGDLTICLIISRVYGVTNVAPNQIQKLDQVMNQGLSAFSRGFVADGDELVCLLDVESLLRSLEFKQ